MRIIKVEVAASGNKPGAAIFMSVLFIKNGLVPVGAEQYVRHPVRRSAHLHTDSFQVNIRVAFDKQFYNRNWNRITIDSFIEELDEYMHWYNEERIKMSLGGMSPLEYRRSLGIAI